eukprot:TRINITY_DN5447_c0_g2_i1.p1 TRINITY_DN5447_c0_g2~~TRINITY_DN5447_c0_g2_i1.p1  ORF type:complete len:1271 (-),score=275.48 TRINITY_DN5447_c0_g2_i1:19-3780(-)
MEQNSENFIQRNPHYQNYQNSSGQSAGLDYDYQGRMNGRSGLSIGDSSMQLPGLTSPNLGHNPMMGGSPGQNMNMSHGMSNGSPRMSGSSGMGMYSSNQGMSMSSGSPRMSMSSQGMPSNNQSMLPGISSRHPNMDMSSQGMSRSMPNQGIQGQQGMGGITRPTTLSSGSHHDMHSSGNGSHPRMQSGRTGSGGLNQNLSRNSMSGMSPMSSMSTGSPGLSMTGGSPGMSSGSSRIPMSGSSGITLPGSLNSGMMSSVSGRSNILPGNLGSVSTLPRSEYPQKLSEGYSYPSHITSPVLKDNHMGSMYSEKMMSVGKADSYMSYDQYRSTKDIPSTNRMSYYGYESPDTSSLYSSYSNYPYTGAPDLRGNNDHEDTNTRSEEDEMYSDDEDIEFFAGDISSEEWKPISNLDSTEKDTPRRSSRPKQIPDRYEDPVKQEIDLGTIESVLTHFYFTKDTMQPLPDVNPFTDELPNNSVVRYLVKWVGWSHYHNSWNTAEELKGAKGIKKLSTYRTQINQEKNILKLGTQEDKERYFVKKELHLKNLLKYSIPEKILNTKVIKNGYEDEQLYLIKWKYLPHIGSTWESQETVEKFPNLKQDHESFVFQFYGYPGNKKQDLEHFDGNDYLPNSDHRTESINWVLDNWYKGFNSVVAYENGLEKEIVGISVLQTIIQKNNINGPFLIITSTNKLRMWEKLIKKFLPDVAYLNYSGDPSSRRVMLTHSFYKVTNGVDLPKFQVLLTDYNTIVKDKYYLVQFSWNFNIYDDAHILSYPESSIYATLRDIISAGSLLLLNTLEVNSVMLSTMTNFVHPVSIDYSICIEKYFHFKTRLSVNNEIKLKAEKLIKVPVCEKQLTLMKHILCSKFNDLNWGSRYSIQNILDEIIKTCCTGQAILPSIEDFNDILQVSPKIRVLEGLLDDYQSKKIVVISKYIDVLELVERLLDRRGTSYTSAFGSLSRAYKAEEEFKSVDCVLISSSVADLSIDLSNANVVISLDPYSNERQLERCKIGTLNEVDIFRIITKDTSEEIGYETLQRAKKLAYYQDYGTFFIFEESRFILNKNSLTKILQLFAQDIFGGKKVTGELNTEEILQEAEEDLNYRGAVEYYLERSEEEPCDVQYWNKVIPTSVIQSSVISIPKRNKISAVESPESGESVSHNDVSKIGDNNSGSEDNPSNIDTTTVLEDISEVLTTLSHEDSFTGITSPNLSSDISLSSPRSDLTVPIFGGQSFKRDRESMENTGESSGDNRPFKKQRTE